MPKTKTTTIELPTAATWTSIVRMQEARDVVKANLTEVESELADARRELDELGAKDETSDEFQVAAARKERSLRVRELYKERLKTIADKIDAAVAKAARGENELIDVFDSGAFIAKPKASDLYRTDPRPVGQEEKPKAAAAEPASHEGVDEHLKASVNELSLREDLKSRLIKAGLRTVGAVAAHVDASKSIVDALDCSEPEERAILKALAKYRTDHRKAMQTAESGA